MSFNIEHIFSSLLRLHPSRENSKNDRLNGDAARKKTFAKNKWAIMNIYFQLKDDGIHHFDIRE